MKASTMVLVCVRKVSAFNWISSWIKALGSSAVNTATSLLNFFESTLQQICKELIPAHFTWFVGMSKGCC